MLSDRVKLDKGAIYVEFTPPPHFDTAMLLVRCKCGELLHPVQQDSGVVTMTVYVRQHRCLQEVKP